MMNLRNRLVVCSLALAVAGAAFAAPKSKPHARTTKGLNVPPIHYKHRTLANGLEVYSVQDKSSPTVAIQIWYRVGSKNDPPGRSGFAHLFEHMMFKSTKNMPNEMMDRLTEDVGGYNNATTRDDATQYYEVVPSNYLETLLWAEGDRLATLDVNEKNFTSERDVVKEEFRYRILAPPYGRFWYALEKNSYSVHPYRRPSIGSIEDLDASTLADVQAFHRSFYRPDNAVLVVVGDFDQPQLEGWVDKYLGVVRPPDVPIPRVTVKEPPRATTKRITEHGPNVPLPAVGMTWLIPPASHPDGAPLTVAATILAQGDSSRLYESLVYRKKIAQDTQADADLREDSGLFIATITMASGHTAEEGEKALLGVIGTLYDQPVGAAELEKAKNQIIATILRDRETNNGKAADIGNAVVVYHDAGEVNRGVERLQAVTAADIERVMRKYVRDGKPLIVCYLSDPPEKAPENGEKHSGNKTDGGQQ
jgi:zinc protease